MGTTYFWNTLAIAYATIAEGLPYLNINFSFCFLLLLIWSSIIFLIHGKLNNFILPKGRAPNGNVFDFDGLIMKMLCCISISSVFMDVTEFALQPENCWIIRRHNSSFSVSPTFRFTHGMCGNHWPGVIAPLSVCRGCVFCSPLRMVLTPHPLQLISFPKQLYTNFTPSSNPAIDPDDMLLY